MNHYIDGALITDPDVIATMDSYVTNLQAQFVTDQALIAQTQSTQVTDSVNAQAIAILASNAGLTNQMPQPIQAIAVPANPPNGTNTSA